MINCELARRLMDERLDGEIGARAAIDLEAHLGGCVSCREIATGLEGVTTGLVHLPLEILPDADVDAVLARTVRASASIGGAQRKSASDRWLRFARYALAAAAVIAALAIVPFALRPSAPQEPTRAEIDAAAQEAKMVLSLASRAVRSAESTARDRVIAREVVPALKHVPVRRHQVPPSRRTGA